VIKFNVSEYYTLDGLTAQEKKEVKKAVEWLNEFLEPDGDKIILSQVGFRTCLQISINNIDFNS
jgi:hypothetical protein